MDQSAQIRASMEGYALAIVGRLETKIGVEGGLQEASHDMFEISMCVDFGDADEGIVVAKFGADCIRRIAFAGWPTIANQELAAMDHGIAVQVDRKGVVEGRGGAVRDISGGWRIIKKKKK